MSAPNNDKRDRDLFALLRHVRSFADEYYPECEAPEITLKLPSKDDPVRLWATRTYSVYLRAYRPPITPWWNSADFRQVIWFNQAFEFSVQQADTVKLLHEAREGSQPAVHQSVILREIGTEATRLSEVFRKGEGAKAWGVLIVKDDMLPGCYRLANRPTEGPPTLLIQ